MRPLLRHGSPAVRALALASAALLSVGLVSGCRPEADVAAQSPAAPAAPAPSPTSAPTETGPSSEAGAPAESAVDPASAPAPDASPSAATPGADAQKAPAAPAAPAKHAGGTALAQLDTLPVKGRAPKTGYDRGSFRWRDDVDGNGCDTRNDILRRDLTGITVKPGTHGCVILTGTLVSPYSGDAVAFDRAHNRIDIDHVVALSDAWQTGASGWGDAKKRALANDPLNLLAVESSLNRQKGDGDAATWLPPLKSGRCGYVARQIAVKAKHGLWVKPAEAEAMRRVLGACPSQSALTDGSVPALGGGNDVGSSSTTTQAAPAGKGADTRPHGIVGEPGKGPKSSGKKSGETTAKKPKPAEKKPVEKKPAPRPKADPPKQKPAKKRSGGPFKNCTEAREAGAAPLHRGDPGYASKLDRDDDGIACE